MQIILADDDWSMRVRPVADDLLEIKIRAPSIEKAQAIYIALVERLKVVHDEIYAARSGFWIEQSTQVSKDIEEIQGSLKAQTNICTAQKEKTSKNGLLCSSFLNDEAARLDRKKRLQSRP